MARMASALANSASRIRIGRWYFGVGKPREGAEAALPSPGYH